MKEFITKSEYTDVRSKSDGLITGKLLARIYEPKKDTTGKIFKVYTEHFIINMLEVPETPDPDSATVPAEQLIILSTETLTYRASEFTDIMNAMGITLTVGQGGVDYDKVDEELFEIIPEILVRSGGSKNKGTYAVPGDDWELRN